MPSVTPALASSSGLSWRCVVEAGCVASDFGIANVHQAQEELQRIQEAGTGGAGIFSGAVFRLNDKMPEALPPIWRCTSAWSGWLLKPA